MLRFLAWYLWSLWKLRILFSLSKKSVISQMILLTLLLTQVCLHWASIFFSFHIKYALLSQKCPYSEFFWSVFSSLLHWPEKLRIWTLFTQCYLHSYFLIFCNFWILFKVIDYEIFLLRISSKQLPCTKYW